MSALFECDLAVVDDTATIVSRGEYATSIASTGTRSFSSLERRSRVLRARSSCATPAPWPNLSLTARLGQRVRLRSRRRLTKNARCIGRPGVRVWVWIRHAWACVGPVAKPERGERAWMNSSTHRLAEEWAL